VPLSHLDAKKIKFKESQTTERGALPGEGVRRGRERMKTKTWRVEKGIGMDRERNLAS